ncbi:hypothetical protein CRN80_29175 [Pseudomonas sp. FDAARGOS_380]|nr:hypothetical protein CRN80_29175 [Pseudomonas sp. FDAARGOS_380]
MGMPHRALRVRCWDAERPGMHSHAERGNDQQSVGTISSRPWATQSQIWSGPPATHNKSSRHAPAQSTG